MLPKVPALSSMPGDDAMQIMRVLCYFFSVIGIASALSCVFVTYRSMDPEPGAQLILMVLPVLAIPLGASSLALAFILWGAKDRFSTPEQWLFGCISAMGLVIFVGLFFLG